MSASHMLGIMNQPTGWMFLLKFPVTPKGAPVLLVPRRVLRRLPWINYEDFRSHHLLGYLPATFSRDSLSKTKVVDLTTQDVSLVDRYVDAKEGSRQEAAPIELDDRDKSQVDAEADDLAARLSAIPTGRASARAYEDLVLRILNTALEPELIDGKPQERTLKWRSDPGPHLRERFRPHLLGLRSLEA